MKIRVFVSLREGVLDPQGKAVGHALDSLGFKGLGDVRISRVIDIEAPQGTTEAEGLKLGEAMAKRLLANEVIEDYRVETSA
ncbi:phosphoribosylformylglycinamidine synthase subunit PurS [Formicincola oecophyllae]|uniref:Phosphoribosylformylglycinamidine synthase subunit PurS n=1 Tax=Formicincola oecophyllae TaxID=2558361 RepID=A0A4Y6UAM8_9PROT|nr:phosphoribosylformylglycinamidine synthase subunit PurS [Formicincola oecophyllae]QDH14000.1 phosphoribosylformylglycinamidine synthase subunit PurS [Formicincola oecophyllae]